MTIVSVSSDIHLEFAPCKLPGGDILLLCGDTLIWDEFRPERTDQEALRNRPVYEEFLANELRKYWKVLLVLGNHCHWNGCLDTTPPFVREVLAKYAPNARLLDNEFVEIDGVRFIGSTLWATYGCGTAHHVLIQEGMKDFKRIKVRDAETLRKLKLTVPDLAELHQICVCFLKEAVETDKPCVMLTHHAPTYLACNRKRFPDGRFDDAYASNLHGLIMDNPHIKMVFHGHSHYRYRAAIGETRVASNSRGYYGYNEALGFDPTELDWALSTFEFIS